MTIMDRAMLEQHLAQAERHVAEGRQHVADQRELVAKLAANDHSELAAKARALLVQFEDGQKRHIEDRDRLRKELDR